MAEPTKASRMSATLPRKLAIAPLKAMTSAASAGSPVAIACWRLASSSSSARSSAIWPAAISIFRSCRELRMASACWSSSSSVTPRSALVLRALASCWSISVRKVLRFSAKPLKAVRASAAAPRSLPMRPLRAPGAPPAASACRSEIRRILMPSSTAAAMLTASPASTSRTPVRSWSEALAMPASTPSPWARRVFVWLKLIVGRSGGGGEVVRREVGDLDEALRFWLWGQALIGDGGGQARGGHGNQRLGGLGGLDIIEHREVQGGGGEGLGHSKLR